MTIAARDAGRCEIFVPAVNAAEASVVDGITVYTPEKVNHVMREIDGEPDIINVKKEYKKVLKKDIHQGVKDTIKKFGIKYETEESKYEICYYTNFQKILFQ